MLDYRIDTFLTVCRTMNYTKAAQLLHITQPAVSQHIKFLENYYESPLFSTQGKQLSLTPQGKYLYRAMSTMTHDEQLLRERIGDLGNPPRQLRLGATMTIGEFDIQKKVMNYLLNHPDFKLEYEIADTKVLLSKLDKGEIDFAVVEGNFKRGTYESKVYKKENFIPVCAANYEFSKKPNRIEDLLHVPLIVREEGSGTREILEHYLHEYNLNIDDFEKVIRINNMNIIRESVKSGCGITFLYEPVAHNDLQKGTLQIIPLKDFHITHDFTFLWPKDSIHKDWYLEICKELSTFTKG